MLTRHKQVPFHILDGEVTEVDEGMIHILSSFKRLGVRTTHSCQGGVMQDAYVAGDRKSFKRFERIARRAYSGGTLSLQSRIVISQFIHSETTIEVSFFTQEGTYEWFALRFLTRKRKSPQIMLWRMLSYDNEWGAREIFRWREDCSSMIGDALEELANFNAMERKESETGGGR